jgi:hypothetical protein
VILDSSFAFCVRLLQKRKERKREREREREIIRAWLTRENSLDWPSAIGDPGWPDSV